MIDRLAIRALNHLLASEPWALSRLQVFSGKTARLEMGAFALHLSVLSSGLFASSCDEIVADVRIRVPQDSPRRALFDRPSLFATAKIEGSADFAETLSFVFRNLRWNAEEDLSRLVGDLLARRLWRGATQVLENRIRGSQRFAGSLAEYFTEENPMLARKVDLVRFCAEVDALRDDEARMEKRIQGLQRRTGNSLSPGEVRGV